MEGILAVAAATAAFVGSHFALSAPGVRDRLVGALGELRFRAAYSTVAVALFVVVLLAYADAPAVWVWDPPIALRHIALTVMPVAFVFVVAGLTTRNPTLVGPTVVRPTFADSPPDPVVAAGPVGIMKVTRHPMMWGIGLWGITHLLANGHAAAMILAGGMTLLALAGARSIDARMRRRLGDAWADYEAKTSFVPFAAMIAGRARVSWGEIGWWRIALGIVAYGVVLSAHRTLFGVSPLPL